MRRFYVPAMLIAAIGVGACGAPPVTNPTDVRDGGMNTETTVQDVPVTDNGNPVDIVTPDVPGTDVPGVDNGTPDAGTRFGRCNANSDCGSGTSNLCLNQFPGGMCTIRCTTDRQCGTGASCFQSICWPTCTDLGGECLGRGAFCIPLGGTNPNSICFPSCNESPPASEPACNTSLVCDPYSGACDTAVSPGQVNGGTCLMDGDCASQRCIPELDDTGQPTGFIGGYCLSFARQVSDQEYQSRIGMNLPRSNCPAESVVLPIEDTIVEGAPTQCWQRCTAQMPCRQGYVCDHLTLTSGMDAFTDGACFPINCADPANAALPNNNCPAGSYCQNQPREGGAPLGYCTPGGTTADGGTD